MLTPEDIKYLINTPETDIDLDTISDYDQRQAEFAHLTTEETVAAYKKEALDLYNADPSLTF